MGSGAREPGFVSLLLHFLAVRPCTGYLTSLGFSFLIYNMEIITVLIWCLVIK